MNRTDVEPLSVDEIRRKSDAAFSADIQDNRFADALTRNQVSLEMARGIYHLGFISGGLATNERIREYINAGGVLTPEVR